MIQRTQTGCPPQKGRVSRYLRDAGKAAWDEWRDAVPRRGTGEQGPWGGRVRGSGDGVEGAHRGSRVRASHLLHTLESVAETWLSV